MHCVVIFLSFVCSLLSFSFLLLYHHHHRHQMCGCCGTDTGSSIYISRTTRSYVQPVCPMTSSRMFRFATVNRVGCCCRRRRRRPLRRLFAVPTAIRRYVDRCYRIGLYGRNGNRCAWSGPVRSGTVACCCCGCGCGDWCCCGIRRGSVRVRGPVQYSCLVLLLLLLRGICTRLFLQYPSSWSPRVQSKRGLVRVRGTVRYGCLLAAAAAAAAVRSFGFCLRRRRFLRRVPV